MAIGKSVNAGKFCCTAAGYSGILCAALWHLHAAAARRLQLKRERQVRFYRFAACKRRYKPVGAERRAGTCRK